MSFTDSVEIESFHILIHIEYKTVVSPAHTEGTYHSKAFTCPNNQLLKPLPEFLQNVLVWRLTKGWISPEGPCSPL